MNSATKRPYNHLKLIVLTSAIGSYHSQESPTWISLGQYRVSSTRGGGFLNVFFADDCHIPREGSVKESIKTVAKSDDREMQRKVYMQEKDLREAVLKGRFKEAKWTQTISMSLLWLMQARLQGRNDS